ncbi:MAG: MarR family transcriptional regulator [Lentisphaerae bacterium]|nr:MarR family transcriptional regulator [Lentisphaerota bacterium]
MNPSAHDTTESVRTELVKHAGRIAQDVGFSRLAGELMMQLYLTPGHASLDDLAEARELSKAAVSTACTQLESLGLIVRVRLPADRRGYYRSADDIGSALRHGILKFARTKMTLLEADLKQADETLAGRKKEDPATKFLAGRIVRLRELNRRAARLLDHPLASWFTKLG